MRGTSIPFDVLETSRTADASGEAVPMLTRQEETPIAPARPFTCETMSFHAAEDKVVPALGKEPHAAAPYEIAENQSTVATTTPEPIWIPSMNFEKRFMRLVFYAIEQRDVSGTDGESVVVASSGLLARRAVIVGAVVQGRVCGFQSFHGIAHSAFDIPSRNRERSDSVIFVVVDEFADAGRSLRRTYRPARVHAPRAHARSVHPSYEFSAQV
ncbi:MAG: hypothetical protein WA194_06505 [Patescibacteria group bacterium]